MRRVLLRSLEGSLFLTAGLGAGLVVAAGLTWLTLASLAEELQRCPRR